MTDFLNRIYLGNTVQAYLIFAATLIISFIAIMIVRHFVLKNLDRLAARSSSALPALLISGIRKYVFPIAYFVAFYLSLQLLKLSPNLSKAASIISVAFITSMAAVFISSIVVFLLIKYWEKRGKDESKNLAVKWAAGIIKTVVWGIALILFLDNIGVKVNSLIAGLGVGGIAIAFAAQAIIADIFCFFTIFFDRPFEIGDFIIAGTQMGTVEHIGIKTTRLRSLTGEQLIFSNSDLTNSRIQNFKTMAQRRVVFTLGVTYDTPASQLKEIPLIIKEIIEKVPDTTFARTHFSAFSAYSLNFETVYFVLSSSYDIYMDINQTINLQIKEAFDSRGIQFAFPTQTLHVQTGS